MICILASSGIYFKVPDDITKGISLEKTRKYPRYNKNENKKTCYLHGKKSRGVEQTIRYPYIFLDQVNIYKLNSEL